MWQIGTTSTWKIFGDCYRASKVLKILLGLSVSTMVFISCWSVRNIPSSAINIHTRYITKKKLNYWFDLKNFCTIYNWYNELQTTKNYSKWPAFALIQRQSLLGHVRSSVQMTPIGKFSTVSTSTCFNNSRLWWLLVQTMSSKTPQFVVDWIKVWVGRLPMVTTYKFEYMIFKPLLHSFGLMRKCWFLLENSWSVLELAWLRGSTIFVKMSHW